jgi:hypothetical protein
MKPQDIIKRKPSLIWYTKNYDGLSDESVVEAVLNYGDWEDVKALFSILGVKRTAEIFKKQTTNRKWGRTNYHKDVMRYFNLYFNRHAG